MDNIPKNSLYSLQNNFKDSQLPIVEPIIVVNPRDLTPKQKNTYRFGGERYSFKAVSSREPSSAIPQVQGLYAFPKGEEDPILSHNIVFSNNVTDSNSCTSTSSTTI